MNRRRSTSRYSHESSQRAPHSTADQSNKNIDNAAFSRLLRGYTTGGYRMVIRDEISGCFEPVESRIRSSSNIMDEEADVRRYNVSMLVQGKPVCTRRGD